jgi:hypothetical protein
MKAREFRTDLTGPAGCLLRRTPDNRNTRLLAGIVGVAASRQKQHNCSERSDPTDRSTPSVTARPRVRKTLHGKAVRGVYLNSAGAPIVGESK